MGGKATYDLLDNQRPTFFDLVQLFIVAVDKQKHSL